MLILSKSKQVKQFYRSDKVAGVPERYSQYVVDKVSVFDLFTSALTPPSIDLLGEVGEAVYKRCGIQVNEQDCLSILYMLAGNGIHHDVIKYLMYKIGEDMNISTFVIGDNLEVSYALFSKSSCPELKAALDTLTRLVYTFAEAAVKDSKMQAAFLFVCEYLYRIIDYNSTVNALKDLSDNCFVVRINDGVCLYNYNNSLSWEFKKFEYRPGIQFKESKDDVTSHIRLDEYTYFKAHGDTFVMHDDMLPITTLYSGGTTLPFDAIKAGQAYGLDVAYKYVEGLQDTIVTYKPIVGCSFEHTALSLGQRNTIKVESPIVKFKISTQDKTLPFAFFSNTDSSTTLSWLDNVSSTT